MLGLERGERPQGPTYRYIQADLGGANLSGAYLYEAILSRAYLLNINLSKVVLSRTNPNEIDLSRTNLSGANLERTILHEADLRGANLEDALSLKGTHLRKAIGLTKEQLEACKAKGAIIDEDSTTSSS